MRETLAALSLGDQARELSSLSRLLALQVDLCWGYRPPTPELVRKRFLETALKEESRHQTGKRTYLVRSIRDDGGQFDSICPSKAFLMGAIYFLFTVRSSSSRLGCGQKHKPVTVPELPGEAVATSTIDHQHHAPSALPPQGPHLPLGHETDARPASSPKSPRTGSSPYPETQRPARSAAQHSAQPRPGRLRRRLRPRRPGRADGRASGRASERACGEPGATRPRRGRGEARALPPRTCVAGVCLAQVGSAPPSAPNLLNSRNGRAGERAAAPAGRTTRRRAPPGAAPAHGAEPNRAAARRAPQRVPGGADAEAPQLTTSPGRGGGSKRPSSALRASELAGARAGAGS